MEAYYSIILFFHFIARDIHNDIVEMLKADIRANIYLHPRESLCKSRFQKRYMFVNIYLTYTYHVPQHIQKNVLFCMISLEL